MKCHERLPAGLSCCETEGISTVRKFKYFCGISNNQLRGAHFEGSSTWKGIKVHFCQPESAEYTLTNKCTKIPFLRVDTAAVHTAVLFLHSYKIPFLKGWWWSRSFLSFYFLFFLSRKLMLPGWGESWENRDCKKKGVFNSNSIHWT